MVSWKAPVAGEKRYNKKLARLFEILIKDGKKGFYQGAVAQEIVNTIQAFGGKMTLEDLKSVSFWTFVFFFGSDWWMFWKKQGILSKWL